MATELRCPNDMYGIASDDAEGTIEVKCKRSRCGVRQGIIVLHTISLTTGEVTGTQRYRNPRKES